MKRNLIYSVPGLFLIGAFASCTKPEVKTNTPSTTKPKSFWRLGNKEYTAVKATKISDPFGINFLKGIDSITNNPENTCTFSFSTYPTQNGVYKIVGNTNPDINEVYYAVQKGSEWYYSKDEDTSKAYVSVDSQKISIRVPFTYVYTSGKYKLAEFTCNIIQTF